MLMKPFPNVFFIIRKFTTIFERVATVVGDFLGMDWTALFQLVDVRRQIFEALPPTPLLPLLQLLHLFTREAKTASVSLATSLVAGEHLNAKSCARKPGIAVLSEAITAYTSDIIRYQINLSAFSANSKSQSIPRWISNQGHRPISWKVSATSGWGSNLQQSQHIEPHWNEHGPCTTGASTPSSFAGARSHGWTLRHLDNSQLEQGIILGNLAPAWSSSEISGPVHIKRFSRRDVSNLKECPLNASIGCVGIP